MNAPKPCPICRKPQAEAFKPFCSKRCQEIDLGRWFTESYKVETAEAASDSAEDGAEGRD
jgi:endogenous inhibitor of DNA gyrase (YacG/DUF329 family)